MSRFDYVKYDSISGVTQKTGKELMEKVEAFIESSIIDPASKQKALNTLEEVYMWIGKGVRNDQIKRNGKAELREERGETRVNKLAIASDPYAYKNQITGAIVYKSHRHGANGVIRRAPEKDRVIQ